MSFLLGTGDRESSPETNDLVARALAALERAELRSQLLGPLASGQAPWLLILAIFLDQAGPTGEPCNLERVTHQIGPFATMRWLTAIQNEGLLIDGQPFGRTLTPEGTRVVIDCVSN